MWFVLLCIFDSGVKIVFCEPTCKSALNDCNDLWFKTCRLFLRLNVDLNLMYARKKGGFTINEYLQIFKSAFFRRKIVGKQADNIVIFLQETKLKSK